MAYLRPFDIKRWVSFTLKPILGQKIDNYARAQRDLDAYARAQRSAENMEGMSEDQFDQSTLLNELETDEDQIDNIHRYDQSTIIQPSYKR